MERPNPSSGGQKKKTLDRMRGGLRREGEILPFRGLTQRFCQVFRHRDTQKCNRVHVSRSFHESVFARVTPSCRPIADRTVQTAASQELRQTARQSGRGWAGWERKDMRRKVCPKKWGGGRCEFEPRPIQTWLPISFHHPVTPSHADASLLCHRETSETRFLFCSSRNVGHPDKLAFH